MLCSLRDCLRFAIEFVVYVVSCWFGVGVLLFVLRFGCWWLGFILRLNVLIVLVYT